MIALSGNQARKLSSRVRRGVVSGEDRAAIVGHVLALEPFLRVVQDRLDVATGVVSTARLKTVDVIVDKLRRENGSLDRIQDLVGLRYVVPDRVVQDVVCGGVLGVYPEARVVDRRVTPSFGYRAVHVVVREGPALVEVQVRTVAQQLWAATVEELGSLWGRGLRYGEGPVSSDVVVGGLGMSRGDVVAELMTLSDMFALFEGSGREVPLGALESFREVLLREGSGADEGGVG